MIVWGHLADGNDCAARYRFSEQLPDGSPDPGAGVVVVPVGDWAACSVEGREDRPVGALRVARKAVVERAQSGVWPARVCWFSC